MTIEVVRALSDAIRAEDADGGLGRLEVRFSGLGGWYEINSMWEGHFMERVAPGAFKKTMSENRANIRSLFNHGFDPQVGQKVLGDIVDLREDPDYAVGVVDLYDTSYNRDLLPGLRAGAYGASMRMRILREDVEQSPSASEHNPKALPERTIREIALSELGPVTFPANPDTSAAVRCWSGTDDFYQQMRQIDPQWVDDVRRSMTTPLVADAGASTSETSGAGMPDPDAPGDHPSGLTSAQRRARLMNFDPKEQS